MNTQRIAPYILGGKIQSDDSQRQAEDVAQRGRRAWLEIRVAGKKSGGFGKPDEPDKMLGPFLGTFTPALPPTSSAGEMSGVTETTVWEVGLSTQIVVELNARIASPHFVPQWEPSTNVLLGYRVTRVVSQFGTLPYFECVKPGATGDNEPDWPIQKGATVPDGAATWRLAGYVTYYEIIGINTGETHTSQTIMRAKEIS